MKRVRFDSVFRIMPNGTIRPLTNVQIADVTFGPGTAFSQAVAFGGVRLAKYAGHDLQVEEKDDRLILKGVYK
ncbi:MAG: hypothetical protein RIE53_09715 [Rhodothermales bacterium]